MAGQKDKIIGGFRVLEEIQAGSGSQGTVYKAICEEAKHNIVPPGTVVALKVMAVQDEGGAQWRKLQKRTAELARLDHPNVVKYLGCFSEQGLFNDVHVVVQEFLVGETLKERLAKCKTGLDVDEGIRVVDEALAGLEYTAGCGLVHRDIKPGNIFLCDDGGVKLIDFEIAKQEGGTATASVGNIRGTFDYMAPDFTDAEFRGDVQSDVFSMGVVLHEVLSGKTPYERLDGDDKQANFAFLSRWSRSLSEGHSPIHVSSRIRRLVAHFEEVLARSLAPRREDRYPDFTSFRKGLKDIRFRNLKNGDTSYQLLQFIGKGGFGEVFKARNRKTGQLVAIKHLMKAAYAERFHREAKIMRKLKDPCFVQFVDFFMMESGGGHEAFLVMAFLDGMPGSSLRDAIKRRAEASMPWRDVFVAFERYTRGLMAMHQQGIFHRDIKPSNLYYPPGHPEASAIMDLGIARDVNGTATQGQVPGTLDYMPPEVVTTDSRGDGGMDIYALGLCLYEALTGKMAFPRLPTGTMSYVSFFKRAKSNEKPKFDAPEVANDHEVLSLLVDMTNPDISRRLKNADELLKRLQSIISARFSDAPLGHVGVPVESGGAPEEPDDGEDADPETVATTALDAAEVKTIATMALDKSALAAIEREKQRIEGKRRGGGRAIGMLAAILLAIVGVGAAVYWLRAPVVESADPDRQAEVATAEPVASIEPEPVVQEESVVQEEPVVREEPVAQGKPVSQDPPAVVPVPTVSSRDAELAEMRRLIEEQKKALEEATKRAEEEQKKAVEEARRKAIEEAQRKAREEEEKRIAEENARREKEEAERAEKLRRQQEELEKRIAEENAKREKEEAERAEKLRRQQEEMEKRIAEENAKREKEAAERAEKLRRQQEELEKRIAEEKARREKEEARIAAIQKQREISTRDLAAKASMYYDGEEFYEAVKCYHAAVKNGYSMNPADTGVFEDACGRALERLKQIKTRCENQIRLGQTPLRAIKELDAETKNVIDWRFDVLGR